MPTYQELLQRAFDPETFRAEGRRVVDLLADHLAASNPVGRPCVLPYEDPQAMLSAWADRFGEEPRAPLHELLPEVLARSNDLLHPRYIGHQCTTALPLAALAGLTGQFLNNGTAIYEMGPVNTAMERRLVGWMAGLAGYGPDADGVLTHGGSIGNLTALLAARQAMAEGDVWRKGAAAGVPGAVLVSRQAHYSVKRAVAIMGLGEEGAMPVDVDGRFHMTPEGLERAFEEARREGRRPFALVANACSTATGGYDDLEMAADFAVRRGLWLHVDGAHGAGALLTGKYKRLLSGIERSDSFIWDAHKNMLMPALVTAVVFRDGRRSYEAFSQKASYLFQGGAEEEWYNFAHRTLECTKSMMGLRLFASLAACGTDFFAGYVEAMWDLARAFAARLREAADFEVAVEPESNIVCFRHLPPGGAEDEAGRGAAQRRIRGKILERGRFYIVQTELEGRQWLRCTLINPRTTMADLEALMEEIRAVARDAQAHS
jgi:L-2,4-diaminobutyrate decarboxylase